MLIPEHEKFHKLGPCDVALEDKCAVTVTRTTAATGEQFVCEVPVYPRDTREQVQNRINFFLSLIQDRMEDENKAVEALESKQRQVRSIHEAMKRNHDLFQRKAKALTKDLRSKKIKQHEFDENLAVLQENLKKANSELETGLLSDGQKEAIALEAQQKSELEG